MIRKSAWMASDNNGRTMPVPAGAPQWPGTVGFSVHVLADAVTGSELVLGPSAPVPLRLFNRVSRGREVLATSVYTPPSDPVKEEGGLGAAGETGPLASGPLKCLRSPQPSSGEASRRVTPGLQPPASQLQRATLLGCMQWRRQDVCHEE